VVAALGAATTIGTPASTDTAAIRAGYISCSAITMLKPGPGVGYFTIELARRVGPMSGERFSAELRVAERTGLLMHRGLLHYLRTVHLFSSQGGHAHG
jgi:hypothetical protein